MKRLSRLSAKFTNKSKNFLCRLQRYKRNFQRILGIAPLLLKILREFWRDWKDTKLEIGSHWDSMGNEKTKPLEGLKIDPGGLSKPLPLEESRLPPEFSREPIDDEKPKDVQGEPGEEEPKIEMTQAGIRMITRTPFSAVAILTGFKGYKLDQEEVDLVAPKVAYILKEFVPDRDLKYYALISLGIDLSALAIKKAEDHAKERKKNKVPESPESEPSTKN